MGVILREVAHPQQTVQDAGGLAAVQKARLEVAHRQLAIGVAAGPEQLAVAGAVHRLDAHVAALDLEGEHVLPELVPVTGGPPQLGVIYLGRLDLRVAALGAHLARQRHERVEDARAGGQPEGRSRRDVREGEQPQLAPQLAMIARLGLLDPLEVLFQLRLGEEGGPVDPREHRARRVAAPVGARDRAQLEGSDRLRARGVRAAAQIGERTVGVERDRSQRVRWAGIAHEIVDQLDLVVLAL